jgi:hypothetical protein
MRMQPGWMSQSMLQLNTADTWLPEHARASRLDFTAAQHCYDSWYNTEQ